MLGTIEPEFALLVGSGVAKRCGAGEAAGDTLVAVGDWPGGTSPLLDRDAKYGTPIEAPSREAMISGLEAIIVSRPWEGEASAEPLLSVPGSAGASPHPVNLRSSP